ncbi:MAG: hypothetical protein AAB678_01375 [Patescibacteria group bacterium]
MRYIVGALLVLVGAVMVVKSEWFYQNFGSISWAEENLGTSGGSRLMYKLIGLILIFVGMMLITGMMQGFLMATIGRLFVR